MKKEITFSSGNIEVVTVDELGLVTAIQIGEAVITVSLGTVLDYNLTFTVFEEGQLNDLLRYFIENSEKAVELEVIRYIGSDDGSKDYDHDIVPSVLPYLFNDPINMIRNMLSTDAPNHSGVKMSSIEWIVIHDTANTGMTAGAQANSNWATNPTNTGSSWHYTVGNDGWYQQLEDDDLGWHAGDGTATDASFIDTGIAAQELKPELTISASGKYVINGIETDIDAPIISGKLAKTSDIVREGLWPVVINGTYHMPATRYITNYGGNIVYVGGNNNGIGIETAVNQGSDVWLSWQRAAKLVAQLLIEHDLELDRVVFHNHFSAKVCPRTAIESNNANSWLKMIEAEYNILKNYSNYQIEFISHNPNILNNKGRIVNIPNVDTIVSYTIKVTDDNNDTYEVTLNTLVKGKYN